MQSAEYLVVVDLLSRPRGRDRERMYRTLRTYDHQQVDAAIATLEQAGVVVVNGRAVVGSAALKALEQLNLIGV
jgi:DNA-binding MurR/RpiR family transcriptional regulator